MYTLPRSATDSGRRRLAGELMFSNSASVSQAAAPGTAKRPLFSSYEDVSLDDDGYDEQLLPEKKRRLSPEQVETLERSFEEEKKLEPERKTELAEKLGLKPRQVSVWLQNRRARWKTKQLERDFRELKAALVTLRADHDALLRDNRHLQSQVSLLTDKLQTHGQPFAVNACATVDRSPADDEHEPLSLTMEAAAIARVADVPLLMSSTSPDWPGATGYGSSDDSGALPEVECSYLDGSCGSLCMNVLMNKGDGEGAVGVGSDEGWSCTYTTVTSGISGDCCLHQELEEAVELEDGHLSWPSSFLWD